MTSFAPAVAAAAAILLLAAGGAAADGLDAATAKQKIEAAGYQNVSEVHQGNIGEWMARGAKDGKPVLLVVYPDGRVALREQMDVKPVEPDPAATGLVPAQKP